MKKEIAVRCTAFLLAGTGADAKLLVIAAACLPVRLPESHRPCKRPNEETDP